MPTRPTAFELRTLATTGAPPPRAFSGQDAPLATDLHAHFAGCPRPASLIAAALAHDLRIDGALLDELGLRGLGGAVPFRALSPEHLAHYERGLALPTDRQSTFRDMERVYRARGPVTKSLAAFPALLDAVAADYAAAGVLRVELSLGDVTRADWLAAAIAGARRAEAAHGLSLRFLTGISRHNDAEWDDDLLDRIESLVECRELVGVDWMGHETNSGRAFASRITRLARWAHRHRPGFVIRVHAGENPAFPENVAVAAEAVRGCDVTLRIGHALYGALDALELLRETGAVVEINLTSNYTLNNIACTSDVPLRALLSEGVECVLGTDGAGLYGTSPCDELRVARLAGLEDEQIQQIRDAESRYLERARIHEAGARADFVVPADPSPRHFTPAVAAHRAAQAQARREALRSRLAALGVPALTPEGLRARLGPHPVCIAGAWRDAWTHSSASSRERIRGVLGALIAGLPDDVRLVTGGTRHGVEGEVHGLAAARGLPVLGALVEATPPEDLDGRLSGASLIAVTPHEKAPALYELMRDADALCLFFGGGNVVHDELRAAANLRLRYLALADVDGASGRYAARVPHRALHDAAQALARLDDRGCFRAAHEPFWHPGPNPTVDVVVRRDDQVLLIRRDAAAPAEPGQWALPGGFVATNAAPGQPFRFDLESPAEAAVRILLEETGLDLSAQLSRFTLLAEVEQPGRDERDTPVAWSRTWLFQVQLDEHHARRPVFGRRQTEDARWFHAETLPPRLAFDHAELLRRAGAA